MRDATRQIMVLQCQPGQQKARFDPADRALPAAVLHRLPRDVLYRLLVRSETVLRWHRNLIAHRHAVDERVVEPVEVSAAQLRGTMATLRRKYPRSSRARSDR